MIKSLKYFICYNCSIKIDIILEYILENPFESGHIKNYILFYVSVVVIMILFFIASTLFHDVQVKEKKIFEEEKKESLEMKNTEEDVQASEPKFKLLEVNSESYNQHHTSTKE